MDKQQIFFLLGIEETSDKNLLKQAYRAKLIHTNPEDDPEGFQALREAYEQALILADQTEQAEAAPIDDSPLGRWKARLETIYASLSSRTNEDCWKELLKDEVCMDLDTAEDARLSCIAFLANHVYLPQNIWILLDREFRIRQDKQGLSEHFPENFISFLAFKVENGEFFDFSLFDGEDTANYDGYMQQCVNAKRALDEGNAEEAEKALGALPAYEIGHPYEDVERMRLALSQNDLETAGEYLDSLLFADYDNQYIQSQCGLALEAAGRWEEADRLYLKQFARFPENNALMLGLVHCDLHMGRWEEGKQRVMDLMDRMGMNPTDEMLNCMKEANRHLIEEKEAALIADPENFRLRLDLGWCYFQNERFEDNVRLLSPFTPPEHTVTEDASLPDCANVLDYNNLLGRTYLALREFEKALPYLKTWTGFILTLQEDDRPEAKRRLDRLSYAYFTQALCLQEQSDRESHEEAIEYFKKSIQAESSIPTRLSYETALAAFYVKIKENELCIDTCDHILGEDENYFPAYTYRQEAYYNLHKAQEVVDDYHQAIRLYPYYLRPYLLAAKVFYHYRQYQDALGVLEKAKEAGLSSNALTFQEAQILRYTAESAEDTKKVLEMCMSVESHLTDSGNDVENPLDVYNEILLCYLDTKDYEQGLAEADKFIHLYPESDNLRWVKGDFLRKLGKTKEALSIYRSLEKNLSQNTALLNDIVECTKELDSRSEEIVTYSERILELNPNDRNANHHLMDYYQTLFNDTDRMEYYHKAVPYATRQLELFPESCYYYVERGILYQEGYELEKALADFQKAAQCRPQDVYAHANWGLTLQLMNRFEESAQILEKSVSLLRESNERTSFPLTCLATTYVLLGRFEEAVALSKEVLETYPRHSCRDLCKIYRRMGCPEKTFELYEKELKEYPNSPDTIDGLVYAHAEAGDVKFGEAYYKKLLKQNDNLNILSKACDFYLDITRDYKTVYKLMGKVLKEKGNSLGFDLHRDFLRFQIQACYFLGKHKEANSYFQQFEALFNQECGGFSGFLERASARPARLFTIGQAHLYTGRLEQAEAFFRSMMKQTRCRFCKYVSCFEAHQGLGLLYGMLGRKEESLEEFRQCLTIDNYNWDSLHGLKEERNKR